MRFRQSFLGCFYWQLRFLRHLRRHCCCACRSMEAISMAAWGSCCWRSSGSSGLPTSWQRHFRHSVTGIGCDVRDGIRWVFRCGAGPPHDASDAFVVVHHVCGRCDDHCPFYPMKDFSVPIGRPWLGRCRPCRALMAKRYSVAATVTWPFIASLR